MTETLYRIGSAIYRLDTDNFALDKVAYPGQIKRTQRLRKVVLGSQETSTWLGKTVYCDSVIEIGGHYYYFDPGQRALVKAVSWEAARQKIDEIRDGAKQVLNTPAAQYGLTAIKGGATGAAASWAESSIGHWIGDRLSEFAPHHTVTPKAPAPHQAKPQFDLTNDAMAAVGTGLEEVPEHLVHHIHQIRNNSEAAGRHVLHNIVYQTKKALRDVPMIVANGSTNYASQAIIDHALATHSHLPNLVRMGIAAALGSGLHAAAKHAYKVKQGEASQWKLEDFASKGFGTLAGEGVKMLAPEPLKPFVGGAVNAAAAKFSQDNLSKLRKDSYQFSPQSDDGYEAAIHEISRQALQRHGVWINTNTPRTWSKQLHAEMAHHALNILDHTKELGVNRFDHNGTLLQIAFKPHHQPSHSQSSDPHIHLGNGVSAWYSPDNHTINLSADGQTISTLQAWHDRYGFRHPLRKVVNRIPAGTGLYQQHIAKYEVPGHLLPQPNDTYGQQLHRERALSGHIDQTANLIARKHGVIVPSSQETPAWLTKRGHAEFINHIHEILDRATDLGVNGFHSYHQRDNDLNSPTGGQITRLTRPRPLVFSFKHHPDFDKALALYDEETHHIHINQPDELDRPINRFEEYEKIMLDDNSRRTQQSSNHRYNRWPQSRGYFALPEGSVAHELGHAMHVVHSNATGRQWYKDSGPWSNLYRREQSQVLKQLSRYGAKNAPELVAEVFNRLIHHQPVPPEMLQLYHDVGGHPLRTERIPEPAWRY